MKIVIVLMIYGALSMTAPGQSPAKLKEQIAVLKAEQRAEFDRVLKDLKGSRDYAVSLWTDLDTAQKQMAVVGTERDGWKAYGEDQHEKFINAEKRVAEKTATILKLTMALSGLSLLIAAYLVAKFYFHLPI